MQSSYLVNHRSRRWFVWILCLDKSSLFHSKPRQRRIYRKSKSSSLSQFVFNSHIKGWVSPFWRKKKKKKRCVWLYKCEQFFPLNEIPQEPRVCLASIHFDGLALQWHLNYMLARYKYSSMAKVRWWRPPGYFDSRPTRWEDARVRWKIRTRFNPRVNTS